MATTKTLTPTNQAITLADFTEKPDNRTNVTNDDKLADAVNALNSNIIRTLIDTNTLLTPLDTESTSKSFEVVGKNVCITFRGQSRSHTENEIFIQIPEGYRPAGIRYFSMTIGTVGAIGQITADGLVTVWSNSPPNGRIACMLSYFRE